MEEDKQYAHPSFGMISVGRVSGRVDLFGSSVTHDHFIRIRVAAGVKEQKYGRDWYHGRREILEVDLTPAQFAEMITNSSGSGVPCTIRAREGKPVEQFEREDDPRTTVHIRDEMLRMGKETATALADFEAKVDAMIAAKAITRKAGEEMKGFFYRPKQNLESNFAFYLGQLEEAADKIIHEKKLEHDAAVTGMITTAGIKALARQIEQAEKADT
jgi:hypothetical protein